MGLVGSGPHCHGLRVDGQPCRAAVVSPSGWCFAHDPSREAERTEARRRGGAASSNVARLRRHLGPSALSPILDRLEEALREVHEGDLQPARGQAMASLARAMVAVLEVSELEERLTALEGRLA